MEKVRRAWAWLRGWFQPEPEPEPPTPPEWVDWPSYLPSGYEYRKGSAASYRLFMLHDADEMRRLK